MTSTEVPRHWRCWRAGEGSFWFYRPRHGRYSAPFALYHHLLELEGGLWKSASSSYHQAPRLMSSPRMSERQFAICGDWALGADSLQWIIYKRACKLKGSWYGVSFVSSTRTILERCMREKGCPELNRTVLLTGLPETFNEWNRRAKKLPTGTAITVMGPL